MKAIVILCSCFVASLMLIGLLKAMMFIGGLFLAWFGSSEDLEIAPSAFEAAQGDPRTAIEENLRRAEAARERIFHQLEVQFDD